MTKMERAIKRPGNILNSASDADRRLNTNIKGLVFWWSGVTIFYLWSGLEIDRAGSFVGIPIKGLSEQEFLFGLWILNVVFWVRLIWRIYISCRYNEFYDDAVREDVKEKKCAEKYIQTRYEEKMRYFNSREKWLFGLGIPLIMGLVAIVCLSCHLMLACFLWLKMVCHFDIIVLAFVFVVLVLVFIAWVYALVCVLCCVFKKLYYEYCREIELQCFLEKSRIATLFDKNEQNNSCKPNNFWAFIFCWKKCKNNS